MANTITIRRRIGSVKNTRQITKAMQLVAASKMRRSQDFAKRSRAYREAAYELLARLNSVREVDQHPLFKKRAVKQRLYVVITSNRGLAGAYDSNILKLLTKSLTEDQNAGIKSHVIAIGKKGAQFVRRLSYPELLAVYDDISGQPTANDIRPLLNTVIDKYLQAGVDEVRVIYTMFKSNLVQEATKMYLLPARGDAGNSEPVDLVTNFEPDVETVISQAVTRLIEVQIWQAILESFASEESMRMMAMKTATDNASDLIDDLTLEYNTARQAAITQELAEITGGAEAINA